MRRVSLEHGIPFWNFFNTMPFGKHFDPTESQLRWQIYTSLAYGAKGVLYFCYWTPRGGEFPKDGAIITPEGRPTRTTTRHAHQRCGQEPRPRPPETHQHGGHSHFAQGRSDRPAEGLAHPHTDAGDYLVGVFKYTDGRRAVLLNNYRHDYTAWPTVEFDVDPAQVKEVNQKNGQIAPIIDDSPAMPASNSASTPARAGCSCYG